MAKTDYDFRANVLTNSQANNNIDDLTEGDLLLLHDKAIPIPADKVGTADSVDKGKIPKVKPDGTWELGTIYAPIEADLSSITPVANTYYVHTGTTGTYTQGIIYLYTGSEYKAINGEGGGGSETLIITTNFDYEYFVEHYVLKPILTKADVYNIMLAMVKDGQNVLVNVVFETSGNVQQVATFVPTMVSQFAVTLTYCFGSTSQGIPLKQGAFLFYVPSIPSEDEAEFDFVEAGGALQIVTDDVDSQNLPIITSVQFAQILVAKFAGTPCSIKVAYDSDTALVLDVIGAQHLDTAEIWCSINGEVDDVSMRGIVHYSLVDDEVEAEYFSSGGTNVVANPTGTATQDLTKLQVGDSIFGIQGVETVFVDCGYDSTHERPTLTFAQGEALLGAWETDSTFKKNLVLRYVPQSGATRYWKLYPAADSTAGKIAYIESRDRLVVRVGETGAYIEAVPQLPKIQDVDRIPLSTSDEFDTVEWVPVKSIGGQSIFGIGNIPVGLVIFAEDTAQSGGWDCPELTAEQVTQAYNALVAGQAVTIVSEDENTQFRATMGDFATGEPSILIQYYWLGWVDYQVNDDEVTITTHKIPEEPAHKITSVTVGTDTIDIVIS